MTKLKRKTYYLYPEEIKEVDRRAKKMKISGSRYISHLIETCG